MNILVENGSPVLHNVGDMSMLKTAVKRLGEMSPEAKINVPTSDAVGLARQCPAGIPIPAKGYELWAAHRILSRKLRAFSPALDTFLERHFSVFYEAIRAWQIRRKGGDSEAYRMFADAIKKADLVVAAGGGFITDSFAGVALRVLDVLEAAHRSGTPTALLGQGIGPLGNSLLSKRAQEVLPTLDLISLREARAGLPLLLEMGVEEERIEVTGDDAVEMICQQRPETLGKHLGVNLRVADYAKTGEDTFEAVQKELHKAARETKATMIPVPISFYEGEEAASDLSTARRLIGKTKLAPESISKLNTPEAVIAQAGRCRVVVTGSYHAGVFALSQGISAVCLAQSAYYEDKFLGLAGMFGDGCRVLNMSDDVSSGALTEAIVAQWAQAEKRRPVLLRKAEQQVETGKRAYQRLKAFIK